MATIQSRDYFEPTAMPPTVAWDLTPADVVENGMSRIRAVSSGYRLMIIIAAIIGVIGVVALIVRALIHGWGVRQDWTYVMVSFGYLWATVAAAPAVAAALRLTRGHWRRPVVRISEIWGAVMIIPFILFLLLLPTLPNTHGRPTIWFGWWGSPWLWDGILVFATTLCGYLLLYVASIPDFAVAREQLEQGRAGWYTRLASGFFGTEQQWHIIERGTTYLNVMYAMLYIATTLVLTADFIMSLIPGYKTAIFPAWAMISGFEGGVAVVIVTAKVLATWGGARDYLGREQFFGLAKIQLAFGLLYVYFTWTDFVIPWYGRMPWEINILHLVYFNRYGWLFALAVLLNFAVPLLTLMWTSVRRSENGPFVAACAVLVGVLLDRIRYYSAAFSTPDITLRELHDIPATYYPNLLDILIVFGAIAGVIAVILLAFRFVPYPSMWEVITGLRLRARRRYHHTDVMIIGKPDY